MCFSNWRFYKVNIIKDLLKAGNIVVGTGASPTYKHFEVDMDMLADSGFDFVLFDTQHAPVEAKQLHAPIQAMRGKKAAPVIRVHNRFDQIGNALDAGARGIIVPMVGTKEEAVSLVRSCKYSPLGERSNSGVRGEWGEFKDYRSYLDMVNEELVIMAMIETRQGLDNIDEIVSVPGIDVVLVGPSDFSIELGVPIDYKSDTFQQALDKIVTACNKHGVVPGHYFIPPDMDPEFFIQKGFRLFTMPWADWAAQGIQNGLASINRSPR